MIFSPIFPRENTAPGDPEYPLQHELVQPPADVQVVEVAQVQEVKTGGRDTLETQLQSEKKEKNQNE